MSNYRVVYSYTLFTPNTRHHHSDILFFPKIPIFSLCQYEPHGHFVPHRYPFRFADFLTEWNKERAVTHGQERTCPGGLPYRDRRRHQSPLGLLDLQIGIGLRYRQIHPPAFLGKLFDYSSS